MKETAYPKEVKVFPGEKFNKLTVIKNEGRSSQRHRQSLVRCECGTEKIVLDQDLRRNHTTSCGCLSAFVATHGKSHWPEYRIRTGIKQRCKNPNSPNYRYYGARGIDICDAWANDFEQFIADVGRRPRPDMHLGRIDHNGNYEKGNARWIDDAQEKIDKEAEAEANAQATV